MKTLPSIAGLLGAAALTIATEAKAQVASLGPNAHGIQKIAVTADGGKQLQGTNIAGVTKFFQVQGLPSVTNAGEIATELAKARAATHTLPKEFYVVPPTLTNNVSLTAQAAFVNQGQIIFALEKPTGIVFTEAQTFNGTAADFKDKLGKGILGTLSDGEIGQLAQPFVPSDLSGSVITPAAVQYQKLVVAGGTTVYTAPGLDPKTAAAIMAAFGTRSLGPSPATK